MNNMAIMPVGRSFLVKIGKDICDDFVHLLHIASPLFPLNLDAARTHPKVLPP